MNARQTEKYDPEKDIIEYLTTLFEPDDCIAYVLTSYTGRDGKRKPCSGVYTRTCEEVLNSIKSFPGHIEETFGTTDPKAGAWICMNPVDGTGRKNENVSAFRYALVECDVLGIEEQYKKLVDLKLPIQMLVHSGGKSLHAIVPVFAKDKEEYGTIVRRLYALLEKNDFPIDHANKNPSRLTRFPGFIRGEKWQRIVGRHLGLGTLGEWFAFVSGKPVPQALHPIKMKDLLTKEFTPLYEPVEGLFTEGLNIYVGASKLGKSWHMLQAGYHVSSGRAFWNRFVTQSPVLYLALEDSERRIRDRLEKLNISDVPDDYLILTSVPSMDDGLIELLDHWLSEQSKPCMIIIDVFQKIKGRSEKGENAYESDYRIASTLKQLADKYHACIVCVHHTNKLRNTEDIYERISGSNGLMACADNTALLQRERGASVATVNVTGRDIKECEITLNQINGQWFAETDQTRQQREVDEYKREPVVIILRELMAKNPAGGWVSYDEFRQLCFDKVGRQYKDGREVVSAISAVNVKLKQIDQIEVTTGVLRTINKKSSRGIDYHRMQINAFQTKVL